MNSNIEEIEDLRILQMLHESDLSTSVIDWIPPGTLVTNKRKEVLVPIGGSPYDDSSNLINSNTSMIYLCNKELLYKYPDYYDMTFYFLVEEKIEFLFVALPILVQQTIAHHRLDFRQRLLETVEGRFTILK